MLGIFLINEARLTPNLPWHPAGLRKKNEKEKTIVVSTAAQGLSDIDLDVTHKAFSFLRYATPQEAKRRRRYELTHDRYYEKENMEEDPWRGNREHEFSSVCLLPVALLLALPLTLAVAHSFLDGIRESRTLLKLLVERMA